MHRRSVIKALGALGISPDIGIVNRGTPPTLPADEDCVLWWRYVHHAIRIDDPQYCTNQFIDMVLMRSSLDRTDDDEASQIIQAAYRGMYSLDDIPPEHRLTKT